MARKAKQDPKARKTKVTFLRRQKEVFHRATRNVVYVKGRRAGGTTGAAMRLIQIAWERPGSRHLWVDTVHRNIDKVFARCFRPVLKGNAFHWNATDKVLRFPSGAYCDFGSAERPDTLEGWGYDFIWVNEAGHVLRDESVYYNTLLPMTLESPRAQFFFIGAPKGPGLFQAMYGWGQDPERDEWKSFRHPSHVNPFLNSQELERLKRHMPDREYRQEILAEFITGEGAVFRELETITTAAAESEGARGVPYVIGVDLARYADFTAAWVGRADLRAAVCCDRFQRVPWRLQVARLASLSRRFNDARLYVDATGVGDPICEDLRAAGLPVEAMVLTAARKRDLIDALAVAIEQQRLTMIPHEPTRRELEAYEQTALPSGAFRTGAPPGRHDDCVIALALCQWGMAAWGGGLILGSPTVSSEFVE
jgi:phage terminase large subunit-like protein